MTYAGTEQKWIVYHSEPMPQHQEKTYLSQLEKDIVRARKSLKKLSSHEFKCEPDARAATGK